MNEYVYPRVRTRVLCEGMVWYVEVEGVRYNITEQEPWHGALQWHRDENKWITVVLNSENKTARFICFGPIYQHDCTHCEFWGTWYGYDVWYCGGTCGAIGGLPGGTIIARHGDDGPDYGSSPLSVLLPQLSDPSHNIGDGERVMPFMDWVWEHAKGRSDYQRAWIMALATHTIHMQILDAEQGNERPPHPLDLAYWTIEEHPKWDATHFTEESKAYVERHNPWKPEE